MDAVEYYQDYIAHFGTKGQTWGLRRHQSYETAPTRSGMVGQEVGEAAKQSERLTKEEKQEAKAEKYRQKMIGENDRSFGSQATAHENKYNKYTEKANKSTNARRIQRLQNVAQYEKTQAENLRTLNKYANDAVRKMTLKDIKKEKVQRGLDVLADIGGVAAGFGMAAAGLPIAVYSIGSGRARQQRRREKRGIREYEAQTGKKLKVNHNTMIIPIP